MDQFNPHIKPLGMTHNYDVTINKFPDPSEKSHLINVINYEKLI